MGLTGGNGSDTVPKSGKTTSNYLHRVNAGMAHLI